MRIYLLIEYWSDKRSKVYGAFKTERDAKMAADCYYPGDKAPKIKRLSYYIQEMELED